MNGLLTTNGWAGERRHNYLERIVTMPSQALMLTRSILWAGARTLSRLVDRRNRGAAWMNGFWPSRITAVDFPHRCYPCRWGDFSAAWPVFKLTGEEDGMQNSTLKKSLLAVVLVVVACVIFYFRN
jgi:hypothetical protein